ncbi:MAG TPA: ATP-binding protein, partial [Candidatus Dormibacteraeota bacterium]|nr:ATP-binding protein [Candidatus Dormibacteraeota bacterium]
VIRDLRNYIFGLRPGILADRQLDQALRALAEQTRARSGIAVEVDVDTGLAAALSGRSTDIVQLTREALSNVMRHAQAATAKVSLSRQGADAVLTIDDNGVGFDAGGESVGNGLRNMRERAATLQGSLEVSSRNGKGTRLRVKFPIRG